MTPGQESNLRGLLLHFQKHGYITSLTWFVALSRMGLDPIGFRLGPGMWLWDMGDSTYGLGPRVCVNEVVAGSRTEPILRAFRGRLRMTRQQYALLELEFVTLPLTEGSDE